MFFLSVVSVIIVSALASHYLFKTVYPLLDRVFLDRPNERSSHTKATPRGGGVVFVVVSSLSCFLFLSTGVSMISAFIAVLLLPLPLAFVGFIDDRYGLAAGIRFGAQLITSCLILAFSALPILWFVVPILLIGMTAVINFTNFMDGLDGLVAGCMAVIIATLSSVLVVPWPLWALLGSICGFLFWNWSPARIFMGDVGSTFLGAVFAGLVLQASSWSDAIAYLLLATPLLGDACLCVLRRWLAGQRVFQPHRLHLFQRLHQAGWPHARVSILYIAATALLAFGLLWGGFPLVITFAALEVIVGIWLDQQLAVPFSVASLSLEI